MLLHLFVAALSVLAVVSIGIGIVCVISGWFSPPGCFGAVMPEVSALTKALFIGVDWAAGIHSASAPVPTHFPFLFVLMFVISS